MKNERRFVKISQYLKYYKVFVIQGAEAATQRCSIKNIFKNCTKFTGKSICRNLSFSKIAGMSTATELIRDSVTGVFIWILCNFYKHLLYRTSVKGCFGIWVRLINYNYLRSRVMTYGFMVNFNMHVNGKKRTFRNTNVYRVVIGK